VKPIFAKLDQQVKQLIEGSGKVAERLFRDLLLAVGRAGGVSDRINTLKTTYRLEHLLAVPNGLGGSDDEALAAIVREVRELTNQQKDTWLKYTSGNRAALEPFGKQAIVLADRAGKLSNRDVQLVLAKLTEVAPALKARAIPPSEAQSLEVATAMLFLESALENYFKLGADFPRQANTVSARLTSAMAGETLPPMDAIEGGLLDEMTRRAQEKLLIFQVGQEVQVNLQNIESVLDGYFRDPARRPDLAGLPAQFAQVQGALMIMELMDAAALNAAVMARVQQFAEGSLDGAGEAAEMVADGLSALGLYITALQQGSATPRDVLMPALLRFGLSSRRRSRSSRTQADEHRVAGRHRRRKAEGARRSTRTGRRRRRATREKLEKAVDDLKRDATSWADTDVASTASGARRRSWMRHVPTGRRLRAPSRARARQGAGAPTARWCSSCDAPARNRQGAARDLPRGSDEVVGTIAENLAFCRERRTTAKRLTTIRRGSTR
jgi:chemosensory pili system protein ChpA (sensor histidine kinase/response regulator)